MKILNLMLISWFFIVSADAADEPKFSEFPVTIKAAPNPPGPAYTESDSASTAHRKEVGKDLLTQSKYSQPYQPKMPSIEDDSQMLGVYEQSIHQPVANSDHSRGTPVPPVPVFNSMLYPYSSITKIIMRYNVNGQDFFYECSAFMAAGFHLVTAGHCIYNFDPNGDGFQNDQKWADEVWAFPGQTDLVAPFQCGSGYCGDWPFGPARAVHLRSYSGWTANQNFDHDWGIITLDRNIGLYTGSMGRSSDLVDSLNYSGYPGEMPFVPQGVNVQYQGFQQDNLIGSNSYVFEMFAAAYGGHSGGPVWKFVNNQRFAVGIMSNSNRVDRLNNVILSQGKRQDLNNWIVDDVVLRPPLVLSELTEYVLDGLPHKSINKQVVGHQEQLTIDYSLFNTGFKDVTRNINITFVASEDERVNMNDFILDQVVTGIDIQANTYKNLSTGIIIPESLPAGEYTIGLVYSTLLEYPNDMDCHGTPCSNKISIAAQPLTVEACTSDIWEDDNSLAQAVNSATGNSRLHSICTIGDVDYIKVEINSTETVSATYETVGNAGDTVLSLLSSSGEVLFTDNDSGTHQFSKITTPCGSNALTNGTYYLKVEEHGNDATIDRYDIRGSQSQCLDLMFRSGFEWLNN